MDFINANLLTILILLPLVGTVGIVLHQMFWKEEGHLKWLTFGITLVNFLISLLLIGGARTDGGFSFEKNVPWIQAINTNYHVGVDGLSLWLVLLTTFIMPIAVISTWQAVEKRATAFYAFLLLLESAMIGVFVSLDLLVFYLFFEASLVPMFFLIGIWGGDNRIYAAVKFFIFTALGSLLMLAAIIGLYYVHAEQTGIGTFDYVTLMRSIELGQFSLVGDWEMAGTLMFFAFALAFSIKVPLFPVHTWLPDAHTEAPTAGSVVLAAILLKMGTYGLMRFNFTIFPDASREFAWLFIALAIIGIIYGALVAMVQPDMKRLVAYSSVAHMGFVVLGMFSFTEWGMQGALYQMLNHGVSTGALFLLVGFIYERRHTRAISEFGGLANVMPLYATLFVFTTMSSIGLPFLNGFVGEFLIMLGMWKSTILGITASTNWNYIATMLAGTGVIFAAVYLLWMVQRVFFGKITNDKNRRLSDLDWREIALIAPLLFLMVFMGVYPRPFLDASRESVTAIQKRVMHRAGGEVDQHASAAEGTPAAVESH